MPGLKYASEMMLIKFLKIFHVWPFYFKQGKKKICLPLVASQEAVQQLWAQVWEDVSSNMGKRLKCECDVRDTHIYSVSWKTPAPRPTLMWEKSTERKKI